MAPGDDYRADFVTWVERIKKTPSGAAGWCFAQSA